jgi:branched-chain amino acid transport system substrate-binding protein
MIITKRQLMRTLVGAAVAAAFGGSAWAQQSGPVKIGVLATLEGPFAAGGADGMRGAELAIRERGGTVAGRKIEMIKALTQTGCRRESAQLVEQTRSTFRQSAVGGEDCVMTIRRLTVTFINGSSGAQATTLTIRRQTSLQHRRRAVDGWPRRRSA